MSEIIQYVRGRDGDFVPAPADTYPCTCDGSGWAGEDAHGRAVVCLSCKEHLAGRVPSQYRPPRRAHRYVR